MSPKPYKKYLPKGKQNKNKKEKLIVPLTGAWWLLMILATFAILAINFLPQQLALKEGEYASSNVYYFGTATSFVSQQQTEEAKNLVASEVPQVYKRDDTVALDLNKEIDAAFQALNAIKADPDATEEEKNKRAYEIVGEDTPEAALTYYWNVDLSATGLLTSAMKEVIAEHYLQEITEDKLAEAVAGMRDDIQALNYRKDAKNLMLGIMDRLDFRANKVFDQVATMAAVEQATSSIQPIQVTVNPGQLLIRRGEKVTASDIETLTALGLQRGDSRLRPYLGLLLLVAICFALLRIYCKRMNNAMQQKKDNIGVIGILIVATLLIGRFVTLINISTVHISDMMLGLAVPVPAFAMLVAALVNRRAAIVATAMVSVFVGIMCGGHMLYLLAALVGGMVGAVQVTNMDQRGKYAIASINIAVAYACVVLAWSFMWDYSVATIGVGFLMAMINGIISVILAIGTLPFLESAFHITTEIRLLELSNTNHPLLKKLMIEAPGTYNHSVLVANLAEAAADEIGGNGLLVRVAAYFHDIGKTKRPAFFIENQRPGENPHDKLQPSLSTFIITSHPKEGIELARKYKLPEEVVDIIEQHHGTSLVAGFYHKAKELAEKGATNDPVREADFRYPGPKPQTKEAALVMLADSCQAAVQAMNGPTKGQMEGRIREVIKKKLDDGQLESCDLTFRDLDVVATVFTQVMAGMNHYRISYPEQLEKELQRAKQAAARQAEGKKQAPEGEGKKQEPKEAAAGKTPDLTSAHTAGEQQKAAEQPAKEQAATVEAPHQEGEIQAKYGLKRAGKAAIKKEEAAEATAEETEEKAEKAKQHKQDKEEGAEEKPQAAKE